MTRADAENRATALNREHPERARYRWMAHGSGESGEVVRMAIPGAIKLDPVQATVESHPRPAPARPSGSLGADDRDIRVRVIEVMTR